MDVPSCVKVSPKTEELFKTFPSREEVATASKETAKTARDIAKLFEGLADALEGYATDNSCEAAQKVGNFYKSLASGSDATLCIVAGLHATHAIHHVHSSPGQTHGQYYDNVLPTLHYAYTMNLQNAAQIQAQAHAERASDWIDILAAALGGRSF